MAQAGRYAGSPAGLSPTHKFDGKPQRCRLQAVQAGHIPAAQEGCSARRWPPTRLPLSADWRAGCAAGSAALAGPQSSVGLQTRSRASAAVRRYLRQPSMSICIKRCQAKALLHTFQQAAYKPCLSLQLFKDQAPCPGYPMMQQLSDLAFSVSSPTATCFPALQPPLLLTTCMVDVVHDV